jgi:beta-glucosidase
VVDLAAGQAVALRVEYSTSVAISIPGTPVEPHLELGWRQPEDRFGQTAALVADCDVALVLAGRLTGESMDADGLTLPGTQRGLISAVAAANPRTIVVTMGAGPVAMPWLPDVPAIIHAWFPGEQFGPALADVLTGRAEPGGRLPITFPTDEATTSIQRPQQYPVSQIYVSYPSDAGEPPAQLKALEVVHLQPAEALQVEIGIPLDDLAIFDELSGSRVVRPGACAINLGVSSAELLLKAEVQIG